MRLAMLLRGVKKGDPSAQIARQLVRSADAARDSHKFAQASALYDAASNLLPHRADLQVQLGNMLKEIGDFAGAEQAYRTAETKLPNDADLALQLGHLFKSAGRLGPAEAAYRRAQSLDGGKEVATHELARLNASGWGAEPASYDLDAAGVALVTEARISGITRDLLPRPLSDLVQEHGERIEWRRLGRRERTFWGAGPVLRGVEAFRGFCISASPILAIELLLNDQLIYRGPVTGGYELPLESVDPDRRKYVFNIWLDLSGMAYGRYRLKARAIGASGGIFDRTDDAVIAPSTTASLAPDSDGVVGREAPGDSRPLDEQINARPSMVRPAGRALLASEPRAVLVQRADQLGDLVVSVPAIRRVRELFPHTQLIGLVSGANRELAQTLDLFDTLVTVDFPAREIERRRVMSIERQKALAAELARYPIDLAIDLSEAESSRLLLPLSGAPLLIGFRSGQFPGLDVDFSANTYDKWNDHEIVPHAKKALGLVEWLGVLIDSKPNLAVRKGLDRSRLSAFGLPADARFVVLHAGARAAFSRWPHYLALAELLIRDEGLHVIMLANDASDEPRISDALLHSGRFQLIHRRLDFDDFDALISFCSVFVGDDSGPKHLASLRGAKVVSVQTARNNWMEWGQDSTGFIITRKVPCAGCLIQTDLEAQECGRDFVCLTAISPEEVLSAVNQILSTEA